MDPCVHSEFRRQSAIGAVGESNVSNISADLTPLNGAEKHEVIVIIRPLMSTHAFTISKLADALALDGLVACCVKASRTEVCPIIAALAEDTPCQPAAARQARCTREAASGSRS